MGSALVFKYFLLFPVRCAAVLAGPPQSAWGFREVAGSQSGRPGGGEKAKGVGSVPPRPRLITSKKAPAYG